MGLQQSRSIRYYAYKEKEWWRNIVHVSFSMYHPLAISTSTFTYYYHTFEKALRRAEAAGKRPDYWYGKITLKSAKKEFEIYREGKVIE